MLRPIVNDVYDHAPGTQGQNYAGIETNRGNCINFKPQEDLRATWLESWYTADDQPDGCDIAARTLKVSKDRHRNRQGCGWRIRKEGHEQPCRELKTIVAARM